MSNSSVPPVFPSWKYWYLLLIVFTIVQLIVYAWMTGVFNKTY
ncbi:MAG: hypothetical protein ACO3FI_12200 [Cyclobacteriaceae bacterium]